MAAASRRAEYAEMTRQAIIAAARELFFTKGYFGTTIEDIAEAARVAPATVYAVTGGKKGLLRAIVETATTDGNVQEAYAKILVHPEADGLLLWMVQETRRRFELWSGLMRVIMDTAPYEPAAAEALELARASLRGALDRAGARLHELGTLRAGIDADQAGDALWFFLNNAAYFSLINDNNWSLDRAEAWLLESLRRALF